MKLYPNIKALAAAGLVISLTACATTVVDSADEATAAEASELAAAGKDGRRGPGPERFGAMFAEADANKDGQLTLEEARAAALSRFTEADTNKDGTLDVSERHAMGPPHGAKRGEGWGKGPGGGRGRSLADIDTNGDGKITKDEAPPRMAEHFDEADANKDGAVDQAELDAIREAHRGDGKGMGRGPCAGAAECDGTGPGRGMGRGPCAGGAECDGMGPGKGMGLGKGMGPGRGFGGPPDADGDGKITKDEVLERVSEWFKRIDANGDGVATEAEHEALRAKRPARARE